jgi:hypothetical protein
MGLAKATPLPLYPQERELYGRLIMMMIIIIINTLGDTKQKRKGLKNTTDKNYQEMIDVMCKLNSKVWLRYINLLNWNRNVR